MIQLNQYSVSFQERFFKQRISADLITLAPANEAIEYEKRVFNEGASIQFSPYMGEPTDEMDDAWENLYKR